jgi:hypothetical protein
MTAPKSSASRVLAALASPPATKALDPDLYSRHSLRHAVYAILLQFGVETAGGLIQVAIGFAGGSGCFLTKRSGFLLKAPSRVFWRDRSAHPMHQPVRGSVEYEPDLIGDRAVT